MYPQEELAKQEGPTVIRIMKCEGCCWYISWQRLRKRIFDGPALIGCGHPSFMMLRPLRQHGTTPRWCPVLQHYRKVGIKPNLVERDWPKDG